MANTQGETGRTKLLVAIILALLIIITVAAYFAISGKQELMASKAERNALASNFKNLSDTLDARNAEIDNYKMQNIQFDSTVSNSQKIIASQKEKLAAMLHNQEMTQKELNEANKSLAEYQASIDGLQKQVISLTEQNQQLTAENQQLSTDLSTVKKNAADLTEQNKSLTNKATLLQLVNIEMAGVKKNLIGKEVVVQKVKSVESLRISFETGANKNLSPGELALFIKITDPKGETIYQPLLGSGSVKLADGSSMQYTKQTNIDWHQGNKKVVVYWAQNIQAAGTYKVEIYQSGYSIGKGEATFN